MFTPPADSKIRFLHLLPRQGRSAIVPMGEGAPTGPFPALIALSATGALVEKWSKAALHPRHIPGGNYWDVLVLFLVVSL